MHSEANVCPELIYHHLFTFYRIFQSSTNQPHNWIDNLRVSDGQRVVLCGYVLRLCRSSRFIGHHLCILKYPMPLFGALGATKSGQMN